VPRNEGVHRQVCVRVSRCVCECVVCMGSMRQQCVRCVFVLGLMYVCVCEFVRVCVVSMGSARRR